MIAADRSDLEKVLQALEFAVKHHIARDESNAAIHTSSNTVFSPLTVRLIAARDRLVAILGPSSFQ